MKSFSVTDIGKKRKMNQDYVFNTDEKIGNLPNLFVVADGMGGHRAGDYASRYTVTQMILMISEEDSRNIRDILDIVLHRVNKGLYNAARKKESLKGCGTTLVAACIKGNTLHVANVGDSRLYISGRRGLRQVTVDHSLVQEMIMAGTLDKANARFHPDKNVITRAVGVEAYLDVDFFTSELLKGELVLMCTDGLTNMVDEQKIEEILQGEGSIEDKAGQLIQTANDNGGLDNISVLIVDPFEKSK